jgi:hypothetical protein
MGHLSVENDDKSLKIYIFMVAQLFGQKVFALARDCDTIFC